MCRGVAHLRDAGVPFGVIFTLTMFNLDELAWVAQFAVEQGARLLQVHPLEEVGRATGDLPGYAPDALELARGFVEVARLQSKYKSSIAIQYDVADLAVLAAHPDRGFAMAADTADGAADLPLADLIAPIIVESDGSVVPLQYNFDPSFRLASIMSADVRAEFAAWKRTGFPRFLALCRGVHERLMRPADYPFVNWYGEVLASSHDAIAS
jgi:MoaA/NifB/PqqE/SkfB family radical SAM enzyme